MTINNINIDRRPPRYCLLAYIVLHPPPRPDSAVTKTNTIPTMKASNISETPSALQNPNWVSVW